MNKHTKLHPLDTPTNHPHRVLYLMGVSGTGKTTIGKLLSEKTGDAFFDGDDFHPPENVAKMQSGQPLNDADRAGWLRAIRDFVRDKIHHQNLIVACSALKESYRQILNEDIPGTIHWVYLEGDVETIYRRMQGRGDHFMPPELLRSQFDDLEPPDYGLRISVALAPELVVERILYWLE